MATDFFRLILITDHAQKSAITCRRRDITASYLESRVGPLRLEMVLWLAPALEGKEQRVKDEPFYCKWTQMILNHLRL